MLTLSWHCKQERLTFNQWRAFLRESTNLTGQYRVHQSWETPGTHRGNGGWLREVVEECACARACARASASLVTQLTHASDVRFVCCSNACVWLRECACLSEGARAMLIEWEVNGTCDKVDYWGLSDLAGLMKKMTSWIAHRWGYLQLLIHSDKLEGPPLLTHLPSKGSVAWTTRLCSLALDTSVRWFFFFFLFFFTHPLFLCFIHISRWWSCLSCSRAPVFIFIFLFLYFKVLRRTEQIMK